MQDLGLVIDTLAYWAGGHGWRGIQAIIIIILLVKYAIYARYAMNLERGYAEAEKGAMFTTFWPAKPLNHLTQKVVNIAPFSHR